MSLAKHIAQQLVKNPKRQADGSYMVPCPAHKDRTPSLAIKDGDNGYLVTHCFAGCPWEDVRAGLERTTDLEPFKPSNEPRTFDIAFPPDYPNPRTHIYRDQNGTVQFVVERRPRPEGGKTFKQHGINSHNMDGVTRIPYNLHHWHEYEQIIIVEGEQAVEALNCAGYPATCNPGGAGNWQEELNQWFKDKNVILIPDNDEPGRKHATKVAENLEGIAASITTADICIDLKDKDDIVQWLQHNDATQLYSAIQPNDPELESFDAWIKREMPPRDYLMGTVICTTSRWMVYAPTGLGKTLFTMNMVTAIAAGKDFLNWKGGRKSRVLYIDGEMPEETFKERVIQAVTLFGADTKIYGLNRDSEQRQNRDIPPLNTDDGVEWLEKQITKYQPDVIAFDSIMCLLTGDMKEEDSWEPIKKLMKSLTNRRIAQIWVHHTGHAEGRSYGSNTREWELDTVLRLDRPKDDGEGFVLNFTKNRLRTHLNADEFAPIQCALTTDGWHISGVTKETGKAGDDRKNFREATVQAYDNLAVGVKATGRGHNGTEVTPIKMKEIRTWCVSHGLMPPKEEGVDIVSDSTRKMVDRAKADLVKGGKFAGDNSSIWRV